MAVANVGLNDRFVLTYRATLFGQRIITTHHFRVSTQLDPPEYLTWIQMAAASFGSQLELAGFWSGVRSLQSSQVHYDAVRVQRISPTRDIYWQQTVDADGEAAEEAETANLAMSVERRCGVAGRHGVGRVQLAGFGVDNMVDGVWGAPFMSLVEAACQDQTDPVSIGLLGTQVRFLLFDPLDPTADDKDILQVIPYSSVRVMRRRTVGLGE